MTGSAAQTARRLAQPGKEFEGGLAHGRPSSFASMAAQLWLISERPMESVRVSSKYQSHLEWTVQGPGCCLVSTGSVPIEEDRTPV